MTTKKKKSVAKASVKFRDLKSKRNPKGGTDVGGGGLSAFKVSIMAKGTPDF
jgi:hypothetical protein